MVCFDSLLHTFTGALCVTRKIANLIIKVRDEDQQTSTRNVHTLWWHILVFIAKEGANKDYLDKRITKTEQKNSLISFFLKS